MADQNPLRMGIKQPPGFRLPVGERLRITTDAVVIDSTEEGALVELIPEMMVASVSWEHLR